MKRFLKYNFLLRVTALIFLFGGKVFGQDVSFTASVSKSTVGAGEQFQVTYTMTGDVSNFQAPSFRSFNLVGGPNESTSAQISNNGVSQIRSVSYIFIAQKEGTYDIPPATIVVNGKKLQSNSLRITVVKGNPPQPPQQQSQGGTSGGNTAQQPATGLDAKSVFVRAVVDRSAVLLGEAITVTYKIYSKVDVVGYDIQKLPSSFTGFWSENIPLQQRLLFSERQYIDGVLYNVGTLKKVVLYPQRSGTLTIDPMEMNVIVRMQMKRSRQSNDPFDMFNPFYNYRDVNQPLKSEPVKINVKELPHTPAGCTFNGTVGKFSAEYSLDRKETKTNEEIGRASCR